MTEHAETKTFETKLDDVMGDLIVGHNFEYARKAILAALTAEVDKRVVEELQELRGSIDFDGDGRLETIELLDRIDNRIAHLTQPANTEEKMRKEQINPENYHCMVAGVPECPVCLVDCADSWHFVDCWVGKAIGENKRSTKDKTDD
jgi:hypothetical protein